MTNLTPSLRLVHVDGALDHCREHGSVPLASFESARNHLAAVVAEHQAVLDELEPLRDEFGIRATFTDTTSAEFTVAADLADALRALDEFDARHGGRVVSRTLIKRPVGDWREIGDERG